MNKNSSIKRCNEKLANMNFDIGISMKPTNPILGLDIITLVFDLPSIQYFTFQLLETMCCFQYKENGNAKTTDFFALYTSHSDYIDFVPQIESSIFRHNVYRLANSIFV